MFDECDTLVSTNVVSTISTGDILTSRFDVYSGTTISCAGSGTPSIVRLRKGVVQWASLPRSKKSSLVFSDDDAESMLEGSASLPLDLVVTSKLRVKANKQGREEVIGFTIYGSHLTKPGRNGSPPQLNSLILHFTKTISQTVCEEWVSCINQALAGVRPSKLLFFINPMAGKGEAARIYQQSVRPFLKAVDIAADVMLLNLPGSMKTYLRDLGEKIENYDGVVAIGGDGTVNELINLSIFKAVEAHVTSKLTIPEPSEEGPPAYDLTVEQVRSRQLYIGVVPAGSTNHIATSLFGSDNPVIATMHLLLGGRSLLDVCALASQRNVLAFATTAIFSAQPSERSGKMSPKRKLLRLASTHQSGNLKQDKDSDFFTALRYLPIDNSESGVPKNKILDSWPADSKSMVSTDSPETQSILNAQTCVDNISVGEKLSLPTRPRWSSIAGSYSYLCLFALPLRDSDHPAACSRPGLLDMVLADTLSRKEQLKNALKKKFVSQDLCNSGATICRARQAFINISVPIDCSQTVRHRTSSFTTTMTDAELPPECGTNIDFDISFGDLKKLSWSSFQDLAGCDPPKEEKKDSGRRNSTTPSFGWYVDGDLLHATSVHVCYLPKLVCFLAMDFSNLPTGLCLS